MPIIGKRAICSFKRTYAALGPPTIHRGNMRYMGECCLEFPNSADLLLFYCSLCRRSRRRLKMGRSKGTFAMRFFKTCSHTNDSRFSYQSTISPLKKPRCLNCNKTEWGVSLQFPPPHFTYDLTSNLTNYHSFFFKLPISHSCNSSLFLCVSRPVHI